MTAEELVAQLPEAWQMSEMPRLAWDLSEVAIGDGMTRIPLLKLGRFRKGKQIIALTGQLMSDIVANFRKRKARGVDATAGDVVVDYEHASENPDVAMGGMVPAAGWLKEIEAAPDENGILWGLVEFTEKARAAIAAKEQRYLSPFIDVGTRDKVSGEPQGATITSVALTVKPFQEWLPAVALSDGWQEEIDRGGAEEKEKTVKVTKLILTDRAAGTVRAVLDDGSEVAGLVLEGLETPAKPLRLSDLKRTADGRWDFDAIPGDAMVLAEVLVARRAQEMLDGAVKDTLITPAQRPVYEKIALADVAGFKEFLKTLQPQIDLTEVGIGGGAAQLGDLNAVDAQIEKLAAEKQAADKTLGYREAAHLVLTERPDLEKRRKELMRG